MKYAETLLGNIKPNITLPKTLKTIAPKMNVHSNLKRPSPRSSVLEGEGGGPPSFLGACAAVCILLLFPQQPNGTQNGRREGNRRQQEVQSPNRRQQLELCSIQYGHVYGLSHPVFFLRLYRNHQVRAAEYP